MPLNQPYNKVIIKYDLIIPQVTIKDYLFQKEIINKSVINCLQIVRNYIKLKIIIKHNFLKFGWIEKRKKTDL